MHAVFYNIDIRCTVYKLYENGIFGYCSHGTVHYAARCPAKEVVAAWHPAPHRR